ncbi:helix-turn-helix transcriptional regulator [Paenibacillus sp. GCM10027626]|uniref:helix-turn-helix transcriptional regulator n=1 Tax=Paenibacillus sp. GCM10027626 TaxID=3273411 RepID=UPI003629335B
MKADRMIAILLYLQNEGKVSAKELAARLEVSERTIMRDMEALSMSGIPVYAERGNTGGWLLAEGYRTRLTGMKTEELMSLIISAHPELLADLGIKRHFDMALQKLLAASPAAMRQNAELIQRKIHIDGAGWHQANEACPYLTLIQEATMAELQLCIHYKKEQETAVRTVHPLGLVAKRSIWYLVAAKDGVIRTYRVARILYAEMIEEHAQFPANFNLAEYWEQSTKQFKQNLPHYVAKIRMKRAMLGRFKQERFITIQDVALSEADWIEATIDFATLEYGCETVLKFASAVEVIFPEEFRSQVQAAARSILEMYE